MAQAEPQCRVLVAVLAMAVLVLSTVVMRDRLGRDDTACATADSAPDGRWCRVYQQDFGTPAPLGSFVNGSAHDWHLRPGHPYADALRSYPDGWGTTGDYSLNYASRTAEVLSEAMGAHGVFRLHGHSARVDGRVEPLGGSFYPVLDPGAADAQQQVAQTYGRYTVRFATTGGYRPTAAGAYPTGSRAAAYGTAFLLWPANDRWAEGEVDYPEMVWGAPISGSVHRIGRPELNADTFTLPTTTDRRWNTATIEWTPGLLVFSLNGTKVRRVTTDVPRTPMRWGFQSGGTHGRPAPDLSGYLYIDSITIDAYLST
jgi:Glycosyl hydrolases family 16